MGRFLTAGASSSELSAAGLLTNRITPKSIIGQIEVPDGVSACFITGVAAGSRAVSDTRFNSASPDADMLAVSPSGNFIIGAKDIGNQTPVATYDPIGLKMSGYGGGSSDVYALDINAGGYNLVVADNGFMLSSGSAGGRISKDAGATWVTYGSSIRATYRQVALSPVKADDPASAVRAIALNSSTALSVFDGANWNSNSSLASASFVRAFYVDGYFAVSSTGATDKTALYIATPDKAASGTDAGVFTKVTVDGANQKSISDLVFNGSLYVALCNDGAIYTAASLTGPWTARASGITSGESLIQGGGRLLAIGSGQVSTSTDCITWTATTAGIAGVNKGAYCPRTGHFVLAKPNALKNLWYSTDCITWTNHPSIDYVWALAGHPAGLLILQASGSSAVLMPDPSKLTTLSLSSSGDGGDLVVMRQNGEEVLRLKGGAGREGGCSAGNFSYNGRTNAGTGMGGEGFDYQYAAGTNATQSASLTDTARKGGGTSPMAWDLGAELYGIKIPGGSGTGSGLSSNGAGGGSIFAKPTINGRAVGYGAGAGDQSGTNASGGGGEGVVRYRVPVTPGEVLLYSAGMARSLAGVTHTQNQNQEPTRGIITFEFA